MMKTKTPQALIKASGLAPDLFAKETQDILNLYDSALKETKGFEKEPAMMDMLEDIRQKAQEVIEKDIKRIQSQLQTEQEKQEAQQLKKAQSRKIMEEVTMTEVYIEECRTKLRAYNRQQRLAAGKTKPIKRKLTTRLKEGMKKIVNMMPKTVKKDQKKLAQTQRIINRTVSDLKKIWGINRIEGIQKELDSQFDTLKKHAEPKETQTKKKTTDHE